MHNKMYILSNVYTGDLICHIEKKFYVLTFNLLDLDFSTICECGSNINI